MVFRLPPALVPDGAVSWPGGFRRGFARPADIKAALRPGATLDGYVAVERGERSGHGWPGRVPVDLEGYVPFFEATVDCGNGHVVTLKYGFVWQLRFTRTNPSAATSTTIPGDSGAPVSLRSADGIGVGLLGFHFFEYNGRSYAVDAETLCRELVGHPGRDFTFA
jgi:hypothetical protein